MCPYSDPVHSRLAPFHLSAPFFQSIIFIVKTVERFSSHPKIFYQSCSVKFRKRISSHQWVDLWNIYELLGFGTNNFVQRTNIIELRSSRTPLLPPQNLLCTIARMSLPFWMHLQSQNTSKRRQGSICTRCSIVGWVQHPCTCWQYDYTRPVQLIG